MRVRLLSASAVAAVGLLFMAIPAGASGLITRGDAEAVLQANLTGGVAIRANAPQADGAPTTPGVGIRLSSNGQHYCADDWHTIAVADVQGGDSTFTQQQAAAILEQEVFTILLDGVSLDLTVTPVKAVSQPEFLGSQRAYYVQAGAVVSPADLPVGSHTVRFIDVTPSGTVVDHTITIFVDASGTGVCLQ
jgi:hypothetical protein